MSKLKDYVDLDSFQYDFQFYNESLGELLMYALPHHQERMRSIAGSSDAVLSSGCMPTIHGTACPVREFLRLA